MGERTRNEMERLSLRTTSGFGFPRDLLQRFTSGDGAPARSDPEEDLASGSGEEAELNLNLGLSLGGRFGVDKSKSNKLVRSSSIAAILPAVRDDDDVVSGIGHGNPGPGPGPGRGFSGLTRTSSLPVETEDEWRKRKELQSLRRLAAKRRRSEKQLSLTRGEREDYVAAMGRVGSSPGPPFRSNKWPPAGGGGGGGGGLSSEGSLSEFGSRYRQGSGGEASSLLQESSSGSNPSPEVEAESCRKKKAGKEAEAEEDMPCVFTKGDGPNGRVVEGILYKYGKGEQVKIMCVCHGSFLSPAEFVKHAGGTDFLNPLKHIVVKPTSSFS